MHILFNFSQLKSGGGQNVAMNFLYAFDSVTKKDNNYTFLVANNSAPHKFLRRTGYHKYYTSPRNPILRIFFEIIVLSPLLVAKKIDVIYTYFGYSCVVGKVKQISGSADSNIYYPEINFWSHYSGVAALKKRLIDAYRIWGVKRADAVAFENTALLNRAVSYYGVRNSRYIPPSIVLAQTVSPFCLHSHVPRSAFKVLFLCGWQLNKNVMLIPEIAAASKKRMINVHFLLTAPPDGSEVHKQFCAKVFNRGVADLVTVIGQVEKSQLQSLYEQVDAVVLLSKLESFSNNIIEAWYFKKPLVIASEEWSRSICKEAAFYVPRDSADDIADALSALICHGDKVDKIIENGTLELRGYPTIEKKISAEIDYAEYVFKYC